MNEKKPFDAAIKYLRQRLLGFPKRGLWSISDEYKQECLDMEAAIRVLEAAEKVEKKEALASLDDIYLSASVSPWDGSVKHLGIVRSLLESLPDKEKK